MINFKLMNKNDLSILTSKACKHGFQYEAKESHLSIPLRWHERNAELYTRVCLYTAVELSTIWSLF